MKNALSFFSVLLISQVALTQENTIDFDRVVAPVLSAHCLDCHSSARPRGGLDLSEKKGAFTGGDSGKVIVAGDLKKSELWQRIVTDEMPPKHPLPKAEKEILKQWILAGAHWGTERIDPYRFSSEKRAGYDWWSLQKLQRPTIPGVKQTNLVRNPIDNFLLAKLQEKGLAYNKEASPRTLIRRLYYDVLGLPPSPEEVDEFCRDYSDTKYEQLVDRLLASPHYGERWARHWLDVARFGESDGFERNNPRNNFWHYRDWIINALNADMPYDQFVRLQIAGDVLAKNNYDGLAASGFLVAGLHNTVVGTTEEMRRQARHDEIEEIVGTVGQTFLGLTMHCARCHDHKFDPISQQEYYQFAATLAGVTHGERKAQKITAPDRLAKLHKEIEELTNRITKLEEPTRTTILRERHKGIRNAPEPPRPYARWEFDKDFRDSVGQLHGTPRGNARLENSALVVDGKSFVETVPIGKDFAEKTLEAWVQLDDLNQRGGGIISLQTFNGNVFDAMVFGEQEPQRWMAGSEFFRRTRSLSAYDETEANSKPVHIALVYRKDGTIACYRNGEPYGNAYKTNLQNFTANNANVVFGLRHAPAGGNKMLRGKIHRAALYDKALSSKEIQLSLGHATDYISEEELLKTMPVEVRKNRQELLAQLQEIRSAEESLLRQSSLQSIYTVVPKQPPVMNVHIRGNVMDLRSEVIPSGVKAVTTVAPDFGLAKNANEADRRRKLAAWLTDSENPLFHRVIVNRLWHYHFGNGIVDTPNDLGFNGGRPSHPALLDWLATELRTQKYSLKAIHRLILTSAAFRQSASNNPEARKVDANNRLIWRWTPRRMDAEILRDHLLSVSGKLNRDQGGPGFRDVNIQPLNGTTYYTPITRDDEKFYRRTIYRFSPRGERSSLLDTFDCPDACASMPRRSVTTTPAQSLSLFNNAFVLQMADHCAKRIANECDTLVRQVDRAFQRVLLRSPKDQEQRLATQFAREHGLTALCRALFNSNEFIIVD